MNFHRRYRNKKRIFSALLAIAAVAILTLTLTFGVNWASPSNPDGGNSEINSSIENPSVFYSTATNNFISDLKNNNVAVSTSHTLTEDITLTASDIASIGGTWYTGTLDGAGHTIYISGSAEISYRCVMNSTNYSGALFGLNAGTIKNLNIVVESGTTLSIASGTSIKGFGIVAGINMGTIENVHVTIDGTVSMVSSITTALGGLVGINGSTASGRSGGTITNSSVTLDGEINIASSGAEQCYSIGGLVGMLTSGSVSNCAVYGDGNIKQSNSGSAQVTYKWYGVLFGAMRAGGTFETLGTNSFSDLTLGFHGSIVTSAYTGSGENYAGAVVGDTLSSGSVTISGSLYLQGFQNTLSATTSNVGETTIQIKDGVSLCGRSSSSSNWGTQVVIPYVEISDAESLVDTLKISNLSGTYKLMSDITLTSAQVGELGGAILKYGFDGNGHTITLSVGNASLKTGAYDSSAFAGGLFAVNLGTISNVKLIINTTLNASARAVGGLVGYNLGTIDGCEVIISNSGAVKTDYSGEDAAAGGLVGVNGRSGSGTGIIQDSFVTHNGLLYVKTHGTSSHCGVGGVVGFNLNGSLSNVGIYGNGTIQSEANNTSTNAWKFYGGIVGGNRGGHSANTDTFMVFGTTSYSSFTYAFTGKFSYGLNAGEIYIGKIFGCSADLTLDKLYYLDPKPENGTFGNKANSSGEVSGTDTGLYMIGNGNTLTLRVSEEIVQLDHSSPSVMDYGKVYDVKEEGTGSISSADELAAFLNGTGAYSSIYSAYLTQDIEYTSSTTVIATTFAAERTLDGNGYSIIFNATTPGTSNGTRTDTAYDSMIIGTNEGIVKNLKVVFSGRNKFTSPTATNNCFSALVSYNLGVIENVSVIVEDGAIFAGEPGNPHSTNGGSAFFGLVTAYNKGYVGYAGAYLGTGAQIEHWGSSNQSSGRTCYTGGLVGYNEGTVEYCSIYGDGLFNSTAAAGIIYVGGIVGYNAGTVDYCYGGFYGSYQLSGASYLGAVVGYSAAGLSYQGLGTYIGGGSATLQSSNWTDGKADSGTYVYNHVYSGVGMGLVGSPSGITVSGAYFVQNSNHSYVRARGFFDYSSPDGILMLEWDNVARVGSVSAGPDLDDNPDSPATSSTLYAHTKYTKQVYVYTDKIVISAGSSSTTIDVTPDLESGKVDLVSLANSGYAHSINFHGYHTDGTAITQANCTTTSCIFPLSGTSNYYLAEDIIVDLTTITQQSSSFSGILYGNGHTITLVNDRDVTYTGSHGRAMGVLTSWLYGAIYDLNVVMEGTLNLKSENDNYGSGIFAGILTESGIIDNCSLIIKEGASFINDNTSYKKQGAHAGFVGRVENGNTITNIYFENNGTITAAAYVSGSDKGWVTVGGIVGLVAGGNASDALWNLQKFFITGSGTIKTTQGGWTTTTLLGSFTTSCDRQGDTISNHSDTNLMRYVYLQDYNMTISDAESRYGIYGVNQNGTTNASIAARIHKGSGVSATLQYVDMNANSKNDMSTYDCASFGRIVRSADGGYMASTSLSIAGNRLSAQEASRYVYNSIILQIGSSSSSSHHIRARYSFGDSNGHDPHAAYGYSASGNSFAYTLRTSNSYYKIDSSLSGIKVTSRYAYAVNKLGLSADNVAEAVFGHDGTGAAVIENGVDATEITSDAPLMAGYNVISDDTHFGLIVVKPTEHNIFSVHSSYGSVDTDGSHQGFYLTSDGDRIELNGIKFSGTDANAPYQTTTTKDNASALITGKSAYTVSLNASPMTIYDGSRYVKYYIINNSYYIAVDDNAKTFLVQFEYMSDDVVTKSVDGVSGYIHQFKLDNITYTGDDIVYDGQWHAVNYKVGTYPAGKQQEAFAAINPSNYRATGAGDYILTLKLSSDGNYAFGDSLYEITHDWKITPAPITLNLTKTDNEVSKIYDGQDNVVTLTDVVGKLQESSKTVYEGEFSTTVSTLNMSGRLKYVEPTSFIGQENFKDVGFYDVKIALSQDLMSDGSDNVSNFTIESIDYSSVARYEIKSVLIKTEVSELQGAQSREYTAAKQYFATSSLVSVDPSVDPDGALKTQFSTYGKSVSYDTVIEALKTEASLYMDVAYVYVRNNVENEYTFINAENASATSSDGAGIGAITTGGAINAGEYRYIGYSLSGNFKIGTDIFASLNNDKSYAGMAYATVYNGASKAFKTTGSDWTSLGAMFGFDFYSFSSSDTARLDKLSELIGAANNSTAANNSAVSTAIDVNDENVPYITKAFVSIVADDQSVEYGTNLLAAGALRSDAYTISALPDAMSKDVFKQSLIDNGFYWSVNTEEYRSILKSYTQDGVTVKYLDVRYDGDGTITAWRNAIAPSEYVDYNLNITYIYGNLTVYQKELKIEWIYNGSKAAAEMLGVEKTALPSAYADSSYDENRGAYVYDGSAHTMTLYRKLNLLPGDESVSTGVSHTGDNAIKGTDVGTYSGFYVYFDPSQSGSAWKNYYLGDGASGSFRILPAEKDIFSVSSVTFNGKTFTSVNSGSATTVTVTLAIDSAYRSALSGKLTADIIKNNAYFTYQNNSSEWSSASWTGATITDASVTLTASVTFVNNSANDGRESGWAFGIESFDIDGANYSSKDVSSYNGWIEVRSENYSVSLGSWSNMRSISVGGDFKNDGHTNWNLDYYPNYNASLGTAVAIVNSESKPASYADSDSYSFYKSMGEAVKSGVSGNNILTRRYYGPSEVDNASEYGIQYDHSTNGGSQQGMYNSLVWFDITTTDKAVAEGLKNGTYYYDVSGIFKSWGEYSWNSWFYGPATLSVMIYGIDDAYDQSGLSGVNYTSRYQKIGDWADSMGISSQRQSRYYAPPSYGSWRSGVHYGFNINEGTGTLIQSNEIRGYSSFRVVFMVSAGDIPSSWTHPLVKARLANISITLKKQTPTEDTVTTADDDQVNLDVAGDQTIYASDVHRLADGNIRFTLESSNKSKIDVSSVSVKMAPTTSYDTGIIKELTVKNGGLKVVSTYSANNTSYNLYNTYKATFETCLDKYGLEKYYLSSISYGGKTWSGGWVRNDAALYGTDLTPPDIYITSVDGINYSTDAADQILAKESLYGGWTNAGTKVVQLVAREAASSAGWSNGVNSLYVSGLKSLELSSVSPQFGSDTRVIVNDSGKYGDISLTLTIEAGKAYYLRATDYDGNTVVKTLYFETNDAYSANNLEIAVRPEEKDTRTEAEENVWTNKDVIMLLSGRGEGNSLARLYYRRIYTSRIPSEEPVLFESSSAKTDSKDGYTEIGSWDKLKEWLSMTADTTDAYKYAKYAYKYAKLTADISVSALGEGEKATVLSLNEGRVLDGNGMTITINNYSAVRSKTLDVMFNAMTFTSVSSRFLYENNGAIINLKVNVSGVSNTFSQNTVYSSFIAINNGTLSGVTMTLSETDKTARNSYEYTAVVGGLTAVNRGFIEGCTLEISSLTVAPEGSNSNANVVMGGITAVNDCGTIKNNTVTTTAGPVSATVNTGGEYEAYAALVAALVNYSVTNYDLISTLGIVVRGNGYTHNPVVDNVVSGYAAASSVSDYGSENGVGVAACYTGSDVNYGWIALQASENNGYIVIGDNVWVIDRSGIYSLEIKIESGTGDKATAVYSSGGNLYYNSFDKADLSSVQSKEVDNAQQNVHDSTTVYERSDDKFYNPEAGSKDYDYYTASYSNTSGVYTFEYHGVGGRTKTYTVNPTSQEVRFDSDIVGTVISSGTSISIFYIGTDKYLVDFTQNSCGSSLTRIKDGGEYEEAVSEGYFNVKIDKRAYNVSFETVIDIEGKESKADTVLNDPDDIKKYIAYQLNKNDSDKTAVSAYANVYWNASAPNHSENGISWKLGSDGKLYEVFKDGSLGSARDITDLDYTAKTFKYGDSIDSYSIDSYSIGSFGYFYYTLDASSENDSSSWTSIEMTTVLNTNTDNSTETWYGIAEIETFKISFDENGKEKIDRTVVLSSFNGTEWDMEEVGNGNVALKWSRLASVNVPEGDDMDEMDEAYNMIVRVHIKYYASLDIVTDNQLSSVYGDTPTDNTFLATISSDIVKGTTDAKEFLNGKEASFYALDLTGNGIYYNPTSYAIYDVKEVTTDNKTTYNYYTKQLLAAQGVRDSELYSIDLYNADPSLMVNMLTPVGDHHLVLKEVALDDASVGNYILNFNVKSYYTVTKRPVYVNIEENFGKIYDGSAVWSADLNRTGKSDADHPDVLASGSYGIKAPKYSYTDGGERYEIGSYNTGTSLTLQVKKDNTCVIRTYRRDDNGTGSSYDEVVVGSHYGELNKGTLTIIVYGTKVTVSKTASAEGSYPVYIDGGQRGVYATNSIFTDYGTLTLYTAPVDVNYAYFMVHSGSEEVATPNVGGTLKLFLSDKSYYTFGTINDDADYTVTDDVPVYTGDEREVESLVAIGEYEDTDAEYRLTFEKNYVSYEGIKVNKSTGVVSDLSNRTIGSVNDYGRIVFNSSAYTPAALQGDVLTLDGGIVYDEATGWSAVELGSKYATMYKRAIYVRATGMSVSENATSTTFDGSVKASSANAGFSEETDEDTIGKDILPVWGTLIGETAELSTKSDGTATGTGDRPILAGAYKISYTLGQLKTSDIGLDGVTVNASQALNASSREDNYYVAGLIQSDNKATYTSNLTITEASNMLYVNRIMGDDGRYRVRVTVSNLNRSINALQFLNAAGDFTVDGVNYFGLFIDEVRSTGAFDMSLETPSRQTLYNNMQSYFNAADGDKESTAYLAGEEIRKQLSSDVRYLVQKALGRIFRYAVNSTQSFATVSVAYNKDSFANFHFDATSGKLTFDYLGDSAKDSAYLADRYSVKIAGAVEAASLTPGKDITGTHVDSSNVSMTTSALSDGQVTSAEYGLTEDRIKSDTAISTAEELQAWLSMTDTTAAGYANAYLTDNILGFDWGIESIDGVVYGGAPVGLAYGRTLDGRGYSIELAGNQVSQNGGNIAMHVPLNADNTRKAISTTTIEKSNNFYASGIFLQYIEKGSQIKNVNFVYTANRYYVEDTSNYITSVIDNNNTVQSNTSRAVGIIAGVVSTSATTEAEASLYNIALEIRGKFGYKGTDGGNSEGTYAIGGIAGVIDGESTNTYGMVNSTIYYYASPEVSNISWTWTGQGSYDIYIERATNSTSQTKHPHMAYGALVGVLSKVTIKNISTRTEKMSDTDTQPKIYVGNSGTTAWMFVGGGIGFSRTKSSSNDYSGVINGYINKFKGNIVLSNAGGEAYVGAISGCTYNEGGSAKFSNVYSYYSEYSINGSNVIGQAYTFSNNTYDSSKDFNIIGGITRTYNTEKGTYGGTNTPNTVNLTGNGTLQGTSGALTLTADTNLNVGYSDYDTSTPGLIDYYFGSNNYGSTYVTDNGKEYVDYYYNTVFINDATVAFNPFGYDGWTAGTVIYDSYLRKTDNVVGTTTSLTPAVDETFTLNGVTYTIATVTEADGTYTVKATASNSSATASTETESPTYLFTFDTTTFSFINEQTQTKYYYGQPHVDNGTSDIKTADASSINIEVLAPNGYFVWDYHRANYTNTLTEQGAVTRLVWSTAIGNRFDSTDIYKTADSVEAGNTDVTKYYYQGRTDDNYWTKSWHNAVLGTYSISASDAPSSEFVYKYTGEVETDPISVTVHVSYVDKDTNQLIDEYYTAKVTMTEEMVNVGSYVVSEFDGVDFDQSASGGKTDIAKMTRVLTGSASGNQIMIIVVPQEIALKDDAVLTKTYDGTTRLVIDNDNLDGFLGKNDNEKNIVVELDYNSKDVSAADKVTSDNHNSKSVLVDGNGNYMSFVKDTSYKEYFTVVKGNSNTVTTETASYVKIDGGSYAYYYKVGAESSTKDVYDEFGKLVGTMTTEGEVSNVSVNCRYYLTTVNYSDSLYSSATGGKLNMADNIPVVGSWIEQTAEEMNKLKAFYYAYMQIIPALRFKDTPFYKTYSESDNNYSESDNKFTTSDGKEYRIVEIYNLYANVTQDNAAAVRFYVLPTLDDGDNGVTARNYALIPDNCYVNPFIIKDLSYDKDGTTLKVGNVTVGEENGSKLTIGGKEYTLFDGYATATTDITVNYTYADSVFTMIIGEKTYTATGNNTGNKITDSGNEEVGSYTGHTATGGFIFETITFYGVTYTVDSDAQSGNFVAKATTKFAYNTSDQKITVTSSASVGAGSGNDANFSREATITNRELDVEYSNLIWDKDSSDAFKAPSGELSFNINSEAVKAELNKNRLTEGERDALTKECSSLTVTILDPNTLAVVDVPDKDYSKLTLIASINNSNFAIKVNKDVEGKEIAAYLGQSTRTAHPIFLYSTLSGEKKDDDKEYYLVVKDITDLQLLVDKDKDLSDASVRLSQDIDASDLTGSINWGSSRSAAVFDGQNHVINNYFCDTIFVSGVVGTVKDVKFMNVESWADNNGEILGLATGGTASDVVIHGTDLSGNTPKETKGINYEMTYYNGDTLCYVSDYLTTSEVDLDILNTYILQGRFTATESNNGLSANTPLLISSSAQFVDAVASFPNLYFKLTTNIYLKSGQTIAVDFVDRKTIDFDGHNVYKSDGITKIEEADINKTSSTAA